MTYAITLENLQVRRGGRPVIHDLSTEIVQQSWFGVVGANGSGKTTLLRAVGGRLPIATGSCAISDRELVADRERRAQLIGFAPPIERLPASLSVRRLLELAGDPVAIQQQRHREL